jgi:hypothetical protein
VFETEFNFDEPMLTVGFSEQFPDEGDGHDFGDPARQVRLGVKKRKRLFVGLMLGV